MKILLIQLRRLGDLILTTPAISALREHLPAAQIALAVSGECAPLLPAIQGLRQIVPNETWTCEIFPRGWKSVGPDSIA